MFSDEEGTRFSPLKRLLEGKKAQDKTRWLNSPNVYQNGTNESKNTTKDASSSQTGPRGPASNGVGYNITQEELTEYKQILDRKRRGEHVDSEQEEKLMMTEAKLEYVELMQINKDFDQRMRIDSPTSPVSEEDVCEENIKGVRSESADTVSAASRSSKEGSPTKEHPGESPKKDKKKKKGLRTPSFLKKKKDKKQEEMTK
jgi:adducin